MAENFDYVETPSGSGGPLLAGDLITQAGHTLLVTAGYLVYGPADGPYTRVDVGSGLPVSIQNATLAATQSGAWTVTVSNTLTVQATNLDVRDLSYLTDSITTYQGGTWLVQSAQSGTWTVQAVQSGTWNVGTVTALASITNPVTVQDGGGSLTVDGAVTASQGGTWNITNISGVVSLPTGAATAARQDAGNASLASIDGKITACNTGAVTVAASALPAGAATAAKQPAPGVAGTPSADVLTVQGSAGMTALAVSGPLTDAQLRASAVPVSAAQSGTWNVGTVTNVVHVDDNGGSLTVDGTVAATQSGAWAVTVGGTVTADTELTTADLDTGAGTDTRAVVGLVLAASGGGLLVGGANPMPVSDNGGSLTVDGTVAATQSGTWNITNVSGTVSLPTGAATSARQDTGNASLASIDGKITACNTGAVVVSSSALPSGAATAAKQPAPGAAGTPSADVLTVQGVTSMTPLKVDGSGVTQPVSGTVTANQGGTWNVGTVSTVTNVVHVDDNSGSLTVDGTVSVGNTVTVQATNLDVRDLSYLADTVTAHQGGTWTVAVTGTVTVADGGGSLTVDGTVAATQSGTWAVRAQDGAGNALTSAARGGERALSVQLVDGSGTQITSFGGGTEYTTGGIYTGTENLTIAGAVRDDAGTPLGGSDGAYTSLRTDNYGRLRVQAVGTLSAAQSGQWSVRTLDVDGSGVTSHAAGGARGLDVTILDGSGNQITSFGGGTEVTEDAAAAANPTGGMLMARRRDSLSSETTTDGDVTALNSTAKGELYVKQTDAVPVTDNGGSLTVDGTVGTTEAVANYTAWDETTAKMLPVGGQVLEPFPGGAIPSGRSAVLRMTPYRAVQTCLYTSGGTELTTFPVTDNGGSLTVDGTVAATQSGAWDIGTVTTVTNVVHVDDNSGSLTVDNNGTFAVQAAQSGTWDITNISGTVSLPTGAATAAKQPALGTAGTPSADVITVQGVTSMTPLKVDGSGATQPVSGTVAATQSGNWSVRAQDGGGNALTSAARGSERALSIQVVDASGNQITSFGGGTEVTEDAAAAADPVGGMLMARRRDSLSTETTTDGDVTAANATAKGELYVKHVDAIPVTDNSGSLTVDNGGTFAVQANLAATGTLSNVSGSASNVTLLASNASRRKAVIVNDSSAALYVKYGTTASTTSYTYLLGPYDTLEETVYTGKIDGIWASATGAARVTEVA